MFWSTHGQADSPSNAIMEGVETTISIPSDVLGCNLKSYERSGTTHIGSCV